MEGLRHLHSLGLVHCDIKPQNVLLSSKYACMLSDLGLCKVLRDNQTSFSKHTDNVGTSGWMAPEVLSKGDVAACVKYTKAVDIFSAGCVLHYLLSRGQHPFGKEWFEREQNVRSNTSTINTGDPLADDMVAKMIQLESGARPSANAVLNHPFFWPDAKRLAFFMEVSDRIEKQDPTTPLLRRLEFEKAAVLGTTDWRTKLDPLLQTDLRKYRTYKVDTVTDLLRAIRNKKHHYRELPENLKQCLGAVPEGYLSYFTRRFPSLLMHTHAALVHCGCHREPAFNDYYSD